MEPMPVSGSCWKAIRKCYARSESCLTLSAWPRVCVMELQSVSTSNLCTAGSCVLLRRSQKRTRSSSNSILNHVQNGLVSRLIQGMNSDLHCRIAPLIFLICVLSALSSSQTSSSKVWVADNGDGTYRNPILHADYSDPDVVRIADDFYLVASSFNAAPGLPILHSKDLVNWTIIGHALP